MSAAADGHRRRPTVVLLAGLLLLPGGCRLADGGEGRLADEVEVGEAASATIGEVARGTAITRAASAGTPSPLPDSAFIRLVTDLSEPDRYFDTDNLISNEASYLHVVGALEDRAIRGGVYLGVGPAQNFSYMTAVRPALAFMVDIRRDNLLQHLWYKALMETAATRLDYLCLLTLRDCGGPSATLTIDELVARVDRAGAASEPETVVARMVDAAVRTGLELPPRDSAYIASVHHRFAADGLDLRFNTHGRAPQAYYPTLRQLLLEHDRAGRHANYLASEESYRWLAALQRANRVVPVVGDLAGDHALRAIADELRQRDAAVSAFYVSNVEYYLFGDGVFPRFVDNLRALPARDDAVLIRSYFNRFRGIPQTVPGYASTQLLQPIGALLEAWDDGRVRGYGDLIAGSDR